MTDWAYWAIFLGAAILIGAFPIAHKWEEHQNKKDSDLWERMREWVE